MGSIASGRSIYRESSSQIIMQIWDGIGPSESRSRTRKCDPKLGRAQHRHEYKRITRSVRQILIYWARTRAGATTMSEADNDRCGYLYNGNAKKDESTAAVFDYSNSSTHPWTRRSIFNFMDPYTKSCNPLIRSWLMLVGTTVEYSFRIKYTNLRSHYSIIVTVKCANTK